MKSIAEMISEYRANLDAIRARRAQLLAERDAEPRFECRHRLTVRIIRLDEIIGSTTRALRAMQDYAE